MAVLLALLSAVCYGASDFTAGAAGRRTDATAVAVVAAPWGLVAAAVGLVVVSADGPDASVLWWGGLSGLGSGVGTLALYRGLAAGRMSVVAPLSAVLAAALPALTGLLDGERLSALGWFGIAVALPAIVLVSFEDDGRPAARGSRRSGVLYGLVAGTGFALLFIGLARAGTDSGTWPLIPGQLVSVVFMLGAAFVGPRRPRGAWQGAWLPGSVAGVLAGAATLSFLAATGAGDLTVVAVLTGLYPAVTVVLARFVLLERWGRLQAVGLLMAAGAVGAISIG